MHPLPAKFEESIRQQLGADFPAFLDSFEKTPPVSIRSHAIKKSSIPVEASVPWSAFGKYLCERPIFTLDPLFHAGTYYVQEASSMFLEQAVKQTADLSKPLKVLDLCAAPGGKSTHLLSLLNRESLLVSNEAIRSRSSILSENIQKWGYPNALVTNNDPENFRNLPGFFDVILVDAPCSGEGLFRKEPAAMSEWSAENVGLCASRQKRIIADVWEALKEDGIFIYCTCTYNPHENEHNLKWLAESQSAEFLKIDLLPSWGIEELHLGNVIGYRFYPHKVNGEGFFLSVIRKREPVNTTRHTRKSIAVPSKKISGKLEGFILHPDQCSFMQFNDLLFLVPSAISEDIEVLMNRLSVRYAGTNIATLKRDKLIPDHALALSVELNQENFSRIEISEEDALQYLRRETIQLSGPTGFTLLSFHEVPIGWVNMLPNRVNNLYPSAWRVRMNTPPTLPKLPGATPRR
ncbi:MAG: rRNA methyltransferase [Bacteroidota bacterium]|nr:rRNA methyltransferase [Bacteroidota bacterium]